MSFKNILNQYGKERKPCFFAIDFLGKNYHICPIEDASTQEILFDIDGFKNYVPEHKDNLDNTQLNFTFSPPKKQNWKKSFQMVQKYIQRGDSYLLNLSAPTLLHTNFDLKNIFFNTYAKYKLLFKNQFVCFSPEIFIKVHQNNISSYPMKGTIDANIPDAEKIILENKKELAEHYTIVDLIRNDLNQIAKEIKVKKFRYIDKIHTSKGDILQVSSEII
ncbi:MAG: aminodeoxychorismate synthase component I, partial [Bacteroidetes bacterium]